MDRPARTSVGWGLGWVLVIGTLPIALAGLALQAVITGPVRRDLPLIAAALIVVGLLLALVDRYAPTGRAAESVTWRDAALLGAAQACALVPGVSRSGSGPGPGRTLLATGVAFCVGYLSIAGLLRSVTRRSFAVFAGHRVLLGVSVLTSLSLV